jgi:hypothetical protein
METPKQFKPSAAQDAATTRAKLPYQPPRLLKKQSVVQTTGQTVSGGEGVFGP